MKISLNDDGLKIYIFFLIIFTGLFLAANSFQNTETTTENSGVKTTETVTVKRNLWGMFLDYLKSPVFGALVIPLLLPFLPDSIRKISYAYHEGKTAGIAVTEKQAKIESH